LRAYDSTASSQTDERQHRQRPLAGRAFLGALARRVQQRIDQVRVQPSVLAGKDVVDRRHEAEQPDVLERARDPECGDAAGRPAGDVGSGERNPAGARCVDPGDQVEGGRFSGAVRSDHGHDRTGFDRKSSASTAVSLRSAGSRPPSSAMPSVNHLGEEFTFGRRGAASACPACSSALR